MARCYEKGVGVAKNAKEAFRLYGLAAKQGHSEAQNNLARCYEKGIGVEKDQKDLSWEWKINKTASQRAYHDERRRKVKIFKEKSWDFKKDG